MGWFDDQIKQRIKNDEATFSDAFASLAETVACEKLKRNLNDDRTKAKNAIDEILNYYQEKSIELPDKISDIDDQLEYIMHPLGIMRRTVKLNGEWFRNAYGAMLAMRSDDNTPVALIPKGFGGYVFLDYKTGKYIKLNKNNADLISDEAICFYRPLPLERLSTDDLIKYMFKSASGYDFVGLCLSAFVAVAIGLIIPKINNIIYTDVVTGTDYKLLFAIFTFLICTQISQILIATVQAIYSTGIGKKMSNSAYTAIVMRLLSLSSDFFKKRSAGEIASSISTVGSSIETMINCLFTSGITVLFSVMYIVQMFKYGHITALYALIVMLVTAALSWLCMVVGTKNRKKLVKEMAHEEGLTYSFITGIQKIKLSGAEKRAFARWASSYKPVSMLSSNPPLIVKLSSVIPVAMQLIGLIVIYYSAVKSGISVGDFFAFNAGYGLVMGAFASSMEMVGLYAQTKSDIDEILPILEGEPEIAKNKTIVTKLMGGIEINNVSFRYSDDMPYVLDNLSLKIRPGQYVAIVGESGCGKSTLMRLLLGFEKPSRGVIYYDGKDISGLDLKSLRKNIGTVMQNERLFQGDIFSNITISAPFLTMDDAMEAARMAGIADDIQSMPMGMNTIISDGSGGISGGQRQRIIIARAIASKPKILMFDEATSALDNITQKSVSESLEKLRCTRIVIAHRLSTIKNCDRIIMLGNGKIVEDGKYDELIKKGGAFADLVKRQQIEK